MTAKAKIKVIKKGEAAKAPKPQKTAKKESSRDIVSTVSNWVTDFQHRRRDETQQALEKFFAPQPQASV